MVTPVAAAAELVADHAADDGAEHRAHADRGFLFDGFDRTHDGTLLVGGDLFRAAFLAGGGDFVVDGRGRNHAGDVAIGSGRGRTGKGAEGGEGGEGDLLHGMTSGLLWTRIPVNVPVGCPLTGNGPVTL